MIGFPQGAGVAARSMEAAHECVMTRRVATGASGSWPQLINDSGAQVRTMPASSGGGWDFGGDQRLIAELAQGVVGLAGQLAGHRQRGPLATEALLDLGGGGGGGG